MGGGNLLEVLRRLSDEAEPVRRLVPRGKRHSLSLLVAEVVNAILDRVAGAEDVGEALEQLDGVGEVLGETLCGVGGDPGLGAAEAADALQAAGIAWGRRNVYRRAAAFEGRACVYLWKTGADAWDVVAGDVLTEARERLGDGIELLAGLRVERGARAGLLCSGGRFWVLSFTLSGNCATQAVDSPAVCVTLGGDGRGDGQI